MGNISIRVDADFESILRTYIKIKGLSLSGFIRDAVLEKIESEIDIKYFKNVNKQIKNTYTIQELQELLGFYNVL